MLHVQQVMYVVVIDMLPLVLLTVYLNSRTSSLLWLH